MSRRTFDMPDAEPPPRPKPKRRRCWECGRRAEIEHHVIPKVLGGRRTLWLCVRCEGKVHGRDATGLSLLIRAGIAARKAKGLPMGRRPGQRPKWSPAKRKVDPALAKSLRGQSVAVAEIAKRFGCSKVAVYQALRDGR